MARPIERLFAMDEMIRSGEYPSIADFMRRFAIQERTAYGDVQYLKRRFHAPIQYSKRQGGYFYTLSGWSLAHTKSDPAHSDVRTHDPTQWLWNEIARRFGDESAHKLSHDFSLHRAREHQYSSRRAYKLCPQCGKRITKRHRCVAEKKSVSPLTCVACGNAFTVDSHFRMRRYCDACLTDMHLPSRDQYGETKEESHRYRREYNTHYQRLMRSRRKRT